MKSFTILLVLGLLLSGSDLTAGVPNTVNYQGKLTDATGSPVPDGAIFVKFTIYDAKVGGTSLWSSGFQPITTVDGIFSYDLGNTVALPDLFGTDTVRYLGITVGADPEISPRTRFTSAGYAYQSQKSVLALDADSLGGLQPAYYLDWNNMVNVPAGFADGVDDTTSAVDWSQVTNIPAGFADGSDDANGPAGGDLSGTYPNPSIAFNAITSGKISDETGFTANRKSGNLYLPNSTAMTDVITVTITIPENGYIIVEGLGAAGFYGSTSAISGFLQIDETAGGSAQSLHYTWAGFPSFPNSYAQAFQTISVRRVYFKTPGTYTFRIEGAQSGTNLSGAKFNIFNSWIQATFCPTAYGAITTVAGQPGDHPNAKAVSVTNPDGTISTGYEMDLRYYEEKARQAEIAAQKAELEKIQARTQLERARQTSKQE